MNTAPSPLMMRLAVVLPSLLFAVFVVHETATNSMPDLLIYRGGAALGLHGTSPYRVERIQAIVAEQDPNNADLIANCGFFLPPLAIVAFAPLVVLQWTLAKLVYGGLCLASGLACWWFAGITFGNTRKREGLPFFIIPAVVLLHPVAIITMTVGQTTMPMAAAILLGQYCFERKRPIVGAMLWALAFVKPHLALALLPVAYHLGGWRRLFAVVAWVGGLTLAGCLVAGGTPLFAFDYLDYLGTGHKAVTYNRVELNWQIVSWNRMLYSIGGPAWNFSLSETLAGYAVAGVLVVGRCCVSHSADLVFPPPSERGGEKPIPSPAWAIAIAVSASLVCCQVLGYELYLLVLTLPSILELIAQRRRLDAGVLIALLLAQALPFDVMLAHDLGSYRPWLTMAVFLWLLARPTWLAVPVVPAAAATIPSPTD